jgi:hypothetical protein
MASCSSPSFHGKSVPAPAEVIEEKAILGKSAANRGVSTHPKSRLQAHRPTGVSLVPSPAPDCELAGLESDTIDMDLWARLKLDYKRHCYEQAGLDVALPPVPTSTRRKLVPRAVTPAANDSVAETRSYCEKAIAEYRDGDLVMALIDFDFVIWLDPNFEDAYINRGIILYRMDKLDLAFDDVVHALRIESSHRIEHPPLPKPSPLLNN